jgi:hypothetical protein
MLSGRGDRIVTAVHAGDRHAGIATDMTRVIVSPPDRGSVVASAAALLVGPIVGAAIGRDIYTRSVAEPCPPWRLAGPSEPLQQ